MQAGSLEVEGRADGFFYQNFLPGCRFYLNSKGILKMRPEHNTRTTQVEYDLLYIACVLRNASYPRG